MGRYSDGSKILRVESRTTWRGITGALLALYSVVTRILGFFGHADFTVTHINAPGWIGVVTNHLVSPPLWLPPPVLLIGMLLIYWESKRSSSTDKTRPLSFSDMATRVYPDRGKAPWWGALVPATVPARDRLGRMPLVDLYKEAKHCGVNFIC